MHHFWTRIQFAVSFFLIPALANSGPSFGFGINVEAESSLGDKFWTLKRIREKRYAKLRQGVHERITQEALTAAARQHPFDAKHPKLRKQVIYGLLFNDDPHGYLFPKTHANPKGYKIITDSGGGVVNGIKWMSRFGLVVLKMKKLEVLKKEEKSERKVIGWLLRRRGARKRPKLEENLRKDILWASHFGDLQYLHAMGMQHESREQIIAKMRAYADHAWSITTGVTTFACLKAEIRYAKALANESNSDFSGGSTCPKPTTGSLKRRRNLMKRFDETDALYHTDDENEFRYRALGSILHMVQDSYAKGHAVREDWHGENSGRIKYFQNYAEQDGHKHSPFDTHKSEDVNNWDKIPGARMAMNRSTDLVNYFTLQCSWDGATGLDSSGCPAGGVKGYLFDEVFAAQQLSVAETATRSHEDLRSAGAD